MGSRSALTCTALCAALAIVGVTGASGQSAPTPAPGCDGVHLVDPKGDNSQPSTDILNIWFDNVGGKTYANYQVNDLKPEIPSGSTEWYWDLQYDVDGTTWYLFAYLQADGTKGFGLRESNGAVFVPAGSLTGSIFTGKNGVIQWELPEDSGGKLGSKLENAFASADEVTAGQPENSTPYLRVVASIDDTTDIASKPYTVKPCEPGASGPTPTATPAPGATPAPAATPAPGGPAPSGGPSPVQPGPGGPISPANPGGGKTGPLDIKIARKVPRARKVKKSLKLSASSARGVSGVEAVLVSSGKKGKVVARGKLARLKGAGKLTLRVSRKLKKGSYTLQLIGRNANGSSGSASVKLRFK